MAGPSWLMDSNRIATKIKCASEACDPKRIKWKSSPTRACPNCNHIIDNSDVTQEWPGLPRGVKFDPSDQEIIWHLLAKVGVGNLKAHPFTDEFIPTVNEDDGICYTHPQNLPGVKQDGSVSHFFHRAIKAYNTGTRKRRKIHGDDLGDVRWHKTGKTKPVILDGIQRGCKKIMVLYSMEKGGKPEKTNWVMHQYHLGTGEDEKDGEFVISKVFYQQQAKLGDKVEQDLPLDITDGTITKVDPVTPKSITPEPPRTERRHFDASCGPEPALCFMEASAKNPEIRSLENVVPAEWGVLNDHDNHNSHMVDDHSNHTEEDSKSLSCGNLKNPETRNLENVISSEWGVLNDHDNHKGEDHDNHKGEDHDNHMVDDHSNHNEEDSKWWEGESQFLLDSQQLVEGLSLCDDLLQSQCSNGDGDGDGEERKMKPCLSDYSRIGVEELKKDLQECQNLRPLDPANNEERKDKISDCAHKGAEDPKKDSDECQYLCHFDLSNIEVDTPPDFRLSQLEFGSQDSYLAWGGSKITD